VNVPRASRRRLERAPHDLRLDRLVEWLRDLTKKSNTGRHSRPSEETEHHRFAGQGPGTESPKNPDQMYSSDVAASFVDHEAKETE
jgi:hypothetical protein